MPRAGNTYDLANTGGQDAQEGDTSTGAGDVKTITAPPTSTACMLQAKTTAARVTFDGTAPGATNCILIPAGTAPIFFPIGRRDIQFDGDGGASTLTVLWLE